MKVSKEWGGISISNLFILVLILGSIAVIYQRGLLDRFLTKEYHSLPVIAEYFPAGLPKGVTAQDVKEGRVVRRGNVIEVSPRGASLARGDGGGAQIQPAARLSSAAPTLAAQPGASSDQTQAAATAVSGPTQLQGASGLAPTSVAQVPGTAFHLKSLPRNALPKEVTLKKPVDFPVVLNGVTSGTLRSNPGTMVSLMEVRGEQIVVGMGPNAVRLISARDTDIYERVMASQNR